MKRVMLVAFDGDEMCFVHVLLNAIDMAGKSFDTGIILEGASTRLIPELESKGHFLNGFWKKARQMGLVEGVCKACSNKMGALKAAEEAGLTLLGDMSGHPALSSYVDRGFQIITF